MDKQMSKQTRITTFVREELAKKFAELTRGISVTALLNRALPEELKYLAEVASNSERAEMVWRRRGQGGTRRFNFTLDRDHAERMDQLCREKRVPRDVFIEGYVDFLVNGEDGICEAPLAKISKMLASPRYEYEEKRRNSPIKDEVLHNLEDESITVNPAVSRENPYSFLHLDEKTCEKLERLFSEELKKK
jgi:hypothetical protein